MPLEPGALLGPYEILGPLGAGGMGEVYKARDTRLERTVAVKVSKQAFEQRFRNEALAIAQLNHPHIAALYDVGPDYLVMEHVEGKPLRGPLPLEEALRLAGQIADALEHAHERGIVHRDLKPANILVAKGGAKVLDFGLARRIESRPTGEESHTTLTEAGAISGTPRYMAPEQIDGKPADARTDIFALGLVLYELVSGKHAFEGTSGARVMAAILEKEPVPISQAKPGTPPALEKVIATCLAKDPQDRWQSVRELKHALEWSMSHAPERRPAGRRTAWTAGAGILLGLVATIAILTLWRRAAASRPMPVQLQVLLPENTSLDWAERAEVSPDGERIAFALTAPDASTRLYVRPLNSVAVEPVAGGVSGRRPFWSPDGRQLGFVARGLLKKVDVSGGPATTLCQLGGWLEGATWSRDGVIVYSAGGRLARVSAGGGEPTPLGELLAGEVSRSWPHFLPDGRHYLYLSLSRRREEQGIYVGALDSELRRRIVASDHGGLYSASGHLLFVKDGALVAQPFDSHRLELAGAPVPIAERVTRITGAEIGVAHFSVSTNGVLAWRTGPPGEVVQLTWFDRSGRKLRVLGEPSHWFLPSLSPDDKSVVACRMEGDTNSARNLWLIDTAGGASRRLTYDPHDDCGPAWSPDGTWVAFFSDRRGVREIYRKRVDGSGDDELLLASRDAPLHVEDWSDDGRFLVFSSPRRSRGQDIFLLPLGSAAGQEPLPFLATVAIEREGALSPNGRFMAHVSSEMPGPWEVYVREVSSQGAPGAGRWQVSGGGGGSPRWRADGRELYYTATDGRMMAVELRTDGPAFSARPPRRLGVEPGSWGYGVTRDGQRFLVPVTLKVREPIRVLVNWPPKS